MTPVIAGIVIGITSMVSTIIGRLSSQLQTTTAGAGSQATTITALFGDTIPTYYFQLIVGLYVVQIVFILTILANGIENGEDKLNEEFLIGKNLFGSTILYCVTAFIIILIFNLIAGAIVK